MIETSTPAETTAAPAPKRTTRSRSFASMMADGARVIGRGFATIWSNRLARIGLVLFGFFVLLAIVGPLISPYSATDNSFERRADPSAAHWLGTTPLGQDVLSQVLTSAQVSVTVALVAGALATLLSLIIGLAWGYSKATTNHFFNFLVNLFLVLPALPLMIVIAAYLHGGGVSTVVLVIVITGWAWGARVLRAQAQTLRSRDFVAAARFSGESATRIVFREILPNMSSLVIATFFGAASGAILAEAGLEFLGLGDSNVVSWGTQLYWAETSNVLLTGQWIIIFAPGLMIALFAVSMALINFGVDALSNPRLREGRK
ncbi:ABC transporter permease [Leifsonia poae]|uniref:ABC transporter permease n=1 Tax=Leifsonia poae TaxID=110933 RepID=UPI003D676C07